MPSKVVGLFRKVFFTASDYEFHWVKKAQNNYWDYYTACLLLWGKAL